MGFDEKVESAIPGMFFMFAGSDDSQTAADISNIDTFELPDPAGLSGGACTSALLQALYRDEGEEDVRYTWAQTLEIMRDKMEEMELSQVPQLSSSRPIDIDEELYIVPPDSTGTKRALLVGINYVEDENGLSGCHNDVKNVKYFLMDYHGFERENMLILADDDLHHVPTKQIIIDGLRRLAEISQAGDVIFIHFSGHGSQVQSGVHVVAVIDSCHSGTAMDLPYICTVGDEEFHRDEAFNMPLDGTGAAKKRKTKEKKKKKKKDKDKDKDPNKKKKKKKKSKDADAEEALLDEEDHEENYEGEEGDEDEEEYQEEERESEAKKKKKKLFGFGMGKKKK
eukprot:scaffold4183_cov137-Cylindrotheca_fusiformis.AAC.5